MASTSETGHAKNVTNFDEMISFVKDYGTASLMSRDTPWRVPTITIQ
jgi:hypothetical protein